MPITNSSVKLFYFHESGTNSITLNADPFYMEDEGLEVGEPEKNLNITPANPDGTLFSTPSTYGTREVVINLYVKDFSHSNVEKLYRWIEGLNYLSGYVNYPLMSLDVKYGDDGGNTYQGFLKVLSAEVMGSSKLFSVAHTYGQSTLGQPVFLRLVCEPFFYKHNPILQNTWSNPTVHYSNGTGLISSVTGTAVINSGASPQFRPYVHIQGNTIMGDVPSPLLTEVYGITTGTANWLGNIYLGMNYALTYPGYVTAGSHQGASSWSDMWAHNFTGEYATNTRLDYRLAGKCMVFANFTGFTTNKIVNFELSYEGLSTLDKISYRFRYNLVSSGLVPVGILNVPYPGRGSDTPYKINITITPSGGTCTAIIIPAWQFRGFIPNGYGLVEQESLFDNPWDNTLFINSATTDGSWYSPIGKPLTVVPNTGARVMVLGTYQSTGGLYKSQFNTRFFYNPRYLYIRKVN